MEVCARSMHNWSAYITLLVGLLRGWWLPLHNLTNGRQLHELFLELTGVQQ